MKIIFLDIDGVLNSRKTFSNPKRHEASYEWKQIDDVDPENIIHLNTILEKTNAQLVISSSWRNGRSLIELKQMAKQVNINPDRIIDKTPCLLNQSRGDEIFTWLKIHKNDVERFVILDDDSDMGGLLKNLVQTDREVGLTKEDAELIVDLLN